MKLRQIFLIDDDELNNLAMKKFLGQFVQEENLTVKTNGWEAIEFLERVKQRKEKEPDLIFMDLKMPDMDGFEFLEYYKKNFHTSLPASKLFVLTNSGREKDKEKALKYECVAGYLSKPLTDQDLLSIIDKYFSKEDKTSN